MKNTADKGMVQFLIVRTENKYIGVCREFGFVEEGASPEEVENKLINGSALLVETVRKNKNFEASLNVAPPFKYLLLFYLIPILAAISTMPRFFRGRFTLMTRELSSLA